MYKKEKKRRKFMTNIENSLNQQKENQEKKLYGSMLKEVMISEVSSQLTRSILHKILTESPYLFSDLLEHGKIKSEDFIFYYEKERKTSPNLKVIKLIDLFCFYKFEEQIKSEKMQDFLEFVAWKYNQKFYDEILMIKNEKGHLTESFASYMATFIALGGFTIDSIDDESLTMMIKGLSLVLNDDDNIQNYPSELTSFLMPYLEKFTKDKDFALEKIKELCELCENKPTMK